MNQIKLREPFGIFLYFFIATCLLAMVGKMMPVVAHDVGMLMQEHIAGTTIKAFALLMSFSAFLCGIYNIINPRIYGPTIRYLVIHPTNFIISLAFVAAAINWGVALSSYVLFPFVARGEIFLIAVNNALRISEIAAILVIVCWGLHYDPPGSKTVRSSLSAGDYLFWLCILAGVIFWGSFFITIGARVSGA